MKKTNINQAPGTLSYSGKYKKEAIVIDVYSYDEKHWLHKKYDSIGEINITESVKWINITGLHDMNILEDIGGKFNISKFVLEDIVQVSRHSKIDTFDDYSFSIYKMLYLKDEKVLHEHVSIIHLPNVLITFQETEGDVFHGVRGRIENNIGMIRKMNVDYLYYCFVDALVDQYFEILPYVNQTLETLEYEILEQNETMLESVYKIRKELLLIKSSAFPMKAILQKFLRTDTSFVSREVKENYDDILDHLDQINETVTLYREIISSLFDTHMSNMSHKMNRVMTTLAIFSAIFIPLSFLAGFFGMNFTHFPGLRSEYSIYIFTAICVLIGGGMFGVFKYKKFL